MRGIRLRAICLMGSVQSLGVGFQRPPIILLLCIRPPGKPHSSKCTRSNRTVAIKLANRVGVFNKEKISGSETIFIVTKYDLGFGKSKFERN